MTTQELIKKYVDTVKVLEKQRKNAEFLHHSNVGELQVQIDIYKQVIKDLRKIK